MVATFKVKKGEALYERDLIIFDQIEYSWPVLFRLMWGDAENGESLIGINSELIIIDRTIVNSPNINRTYIQHVPTSIYKASYPFYSLSEPWLINKIGKNYEMPIEFPSIDFPLLHHINSEFKGYIFKKRGFS